jgi:hypothetical protein
MNIKYNKKYETNTVIIAINMSVSINSKYYNVTILRKALLDSLNNLYK